jgi:hypothetical protein
MSKPHYLRGQSRVSNAEHYLRQYAGAGDAFVRELTAATTMKLTVAGSPTPVPRSSPRAAPDDLIVA